MNYDIELDGLKATVTLDKNGDINITQPSVRDVGNMDHIFLTRSGAEELLTTLDIILSETADEIEEGGGSPAFDTEADGFVTLYPSYECDECLGRLPDDDYVPGDYDAAPPGTIVEDPVDRSARAFYPAPVWMRL